MKRSILLSGIMIITLFFSSAACANKNNLISELDFDKLLFVKRYTYQSNHYYTDYINGCEYFGGNICVLSLKDGTVTELVPSMRHGIFGRYDLSFDGKRIVFDWKESIGQGFRIYEVGVDGKGLRQLTFPPDDEQQRI
ncbi:MAG: TolB-like translocation protein, partial [Planctomycetota bacterium]